MRCSTFRAVPPEPERGGYSFTVYDVPVSPTSDTDRYLFISGGTYTVCMRQYSAVPQCTLHYTGGMSLIVQTEVPLGFAGERTTTYVLRRMF